jgi:hypothetical protein
MCRSEGEETPTINPEGRDSNYTKSGDVCDKPSPSRPITLDRLRVR